MSLSLKAAPPSSPFLARGDSFLRSLFSPVSCPSTARFPPAQKLSGPVVFCASKGASSRTLSAVIFEPFEEVKKELSLVPSEPHTSLARQKYSDESEAALNEQINVEYNVSYVYHAMYAYFDRDNVALKGLAKFFKESSEEEREHAEILMEYQIAERNHDVQMTDFIESTFLVEQVESIKKISEYVAQLRRVGKGHGVWHFDQMLLRGDEAGA
ncbi:hypothetical protein CDL15_Pgr025771 [Punica granatum]|uniref:Ferritin n=1 Tax=Punica granatum TaxID=22663 RepID=A0A218WCW5_PUNGR|nr:hypothetical protein CDL15_Pgr025771 [Punica granatum]